MSIFERWKSPTPLFFKKVIRVSLIAAAGAGAALMVEPVGQAIVGKNFSFTLLPIVTILCKNIVACGIVSAAVAKAAKADTITEEVNIKKTTEIEEPEKVKVDLTNFPESTSVPSQPKTDK